MVGNAGEGCGQEEGRRRMGSEEKVMHSGRGDLEEGNKDMGGEKEGHNGCDKRRRIRRGMKGKRVSREMGTGSDEEVDGLENEQQRDKGRKGEKWERQCGGKAS